MDPALAACVQLGLAGPHRATGFPHLGIDVAPRRGKLLVFHNCLPGTTTRDPRSYHQGKAPVRVDKWAFNLKFHERPYQETR